MDKLILVDENDNQIGFEDKLKAHKNGKLHRAFSIFVFNSKNELMLQKRAKNKYHSAGLWSNTVCSHQRPNELTINAAYRRLKEEMGFDCELQEVFSFIYKVELDNDLFEYEYDHVLVGKFDGIPIVNSDEAEDWKWIDINTLLKDIKENPKLYTYWLKFIIDRVIKMYKNLKL